MKLLQRVNSSALGHPMDDFLAIGISQSRVYLVYNLGSGLTTVRSSSAIEKERKWHFVVAGRTGKRCYLYVDSQAKVEASSPGHAYSLDVFTPLYIGGVLFDCFTGKSLSRMEKVLVSTLEVL